MIQKKSRVLYALLRTKWMQQLRSHSNALSGCLELLYGAWGIQRQGDDRQHAQSRGTYSSDLALRSNVLTSQFQQTH